MKKIVLGAAAALALTAAALAPTGASAGWKHGWKGHGFGHGHVVIRGGYYCPRVPVTVWTHYGPVVKFVRSCRF
jgi:hypothetical protein